MSFTHPADAASMALAAADPAALAGLMDENQRALEAHLARQRFVILTGVAGGGGAVDIAHGLNLAVASVLLAQAFYDNGGVTVPCDVDSVGASDVSVINAGALADVRVTLVVARLQNF